MHPLIGGFLILFGLSTISEIINSHATIEELKWRTEHGITSKEK